MGKVRVYHPDGDFVIEVPDDAKMTFGYFNPTAPKFEGTDRGGFNRHDPNVARQTALRIYSGALSKKNQIACFLGASGYRMEDMTVTKLEQKVTVTRSYVNDPATGIIEDNNKREIEETAVVEKGIYF